MSSKEEIEKNILELEKVIEEVLIEIKGLQEGQKTLMTTNRRKFAINLNRLNVLKSKILEKQEELEEEKDELEKVEGRITRKTKREIKQIKKEKIDPIITFEDKEKKKLCFNNDELGMGSLENDQSIITFSIDGRNFCYNYNALVKSLNSKEDVEDGQEYYINIFCDWVKNEHASAWDPENKIFHCLDNFDQGDGGHCGKRLFFKLTIQAGSPVYFDAKAMNLLFLTPPESQTFSFNVVPTNEKVRVGNYLAVPGVSMSHGQADPNREGATIYTLEKLTDENAEKIKTLNEVIVSMNPTKPTEQLDYEVIQKIEKGTTGKKEEGQFSDLFSKKSLDTHPIPEHCIAMPAPNQAWHNYQTEVQRIDDPLLLNTNIEQQTIENYPEEKEKLFVIYYRRDDKIYLMALMNTTVIGITPGNYPNGLIVKTTPSTGKSEESYYLFIKKPEGYDGEYNNELPLLDDPICFGYNENDFSPFITCHNECDQDGSCQGLQNLLQGGIIKNLTEINDILDNNQKISPNTPIISIIQNAPGTGLALSWEFENVTYLDSDKKSQTKDIFPILYDDDVQAMDIDSASSGPYGYHSPPSSPLSDRGIIRNMSPPPLLNFNFISDGIPSSSPSPSPSTSRRRRREEEEEEQGIRRRRSVRPRTNTGGKKTLKKYNRKRKPALKKRQRRRTKRKPAFKKRPRRKTKRK